MNNVFLRFPGGKPKAVTFSYDDGVVQDQRLAALFDKYGLKATFNIPGEGKRKFNYTGEQLHEYFLSKGHEVAVHGAFHRANGNIRPIEGIREVLECRLQLEEKCGTIIRGMAYPGTGITLFDAGGSYQQIKNYLQELDIAYARTLGGDNDSFLLPSDFHAWMPSVHHSNPKTAEYVDKFLALDLSVGTYHERRGPRLLYIWGHSYEFDRADNWEFMEEICAKVSNNEDIWYATNMEIYDYVEAFKRLRYSANGKRVHNPSLQPVWLDVDGTLFAVGPDETVTIEE